MNILFHENFLNNRGTSVALFDYAFFNETLLGNKSLIVCNGKLNNNPEVIKKFEEFFKVYFYNDFSEINEIVIKEKIDVFYIIKSGENDGKIVPNVKNIVHSVFNSKPIHKHGDIYATVSEWLSSLSNYEIPYVSHMINLPDIKKNKREELSIPENAIVFGRYGGFETFDIDFVYNAIFKFLNIRDDVYFLFSNTKKFIEHNRVIFLNEIIDLEEKVSFINTCDAMIHARIQGESFGLSVLEFASKNKQIITYGDSLEKSHISYLNGNCFIYRNESELINIFTKIKKETPFDTKFLNYKFSPEVIMEDFKNVFLI